MIAQPDLFGPCALVLAIRHAVRARGTDPVKTCACKQPCWWRNSNNATSRAVRGDDGGECG